MSIYFFFQTTNSLGEGEKEMKKEYKQPAITKINLKADEAVLSACKGTPLTIGPGGNTFLVCTVLDTFTPCKDIGS